MIERVQRADQGPVVVSEAVVLETLQVLGRRYGVRLEDAAADLAQALHHDVFESDPDVLEALGIVATRPALGFVDAVLLARARSSGAPVLTFDRALGRALASDSSAP
jgi:predicted nucleic acid-binding protein